MDSIRVSEAPDPSSILGEATNPSMIYSRWVFFIITGSLPDLPDYSSKYILTISHIRQAGIPVEATKPIKKLILMGFFNIQIPNNILATKLPQHCCWGRQGFLSRLLLQHQRKTKPAETNRNIPCFRK